MNEIRYEPIPPAHLDEVRAAGRDDSENEFAPRVDPEGELPLRCCLRDSVSGERVALIAYTPPGGYGPYAERGPVFVHADPCPGYTDVRTFPPGLAHRTQVVRGYDAAGTIRSGSVEHGGVEVQRAVRELFADPQITVVHARNVVAGCFNFVARRV